MSTLWGFDPGCSRTASQELDAIAEIVVNFNLQSDFRWDCTKQPHDFSLVTNGGLCINIQLKAHRAETDHRDRSRTTTVKDLGRMSNVDHFFIYSYDFVNTKLFVLSTDELVEAMDNRNLHVGSDSVDISPLQREAMCHEAGLASWVERLLDDRLPVECPTADCGSSVEHYKRCVFDEGDECSVCELDFGSNRDVMACFGCGSTKYLECF